jgi:hypothetical protein
MKKLRMWAVIALVGFLIGKSAESEVKPVRDVVTWYDQINKSF